MEKEIDHINFDNHIERNWFDQLKQYTFSYFQNLPSKKGFSQPPPNFEDSIKANASIGEATTFSEILEFITKTLDEGGIQAASGNHCGYIPGGGLFENAVGNFIACVGNYYSGVAFASPIAVELENEVIRWACNAVGYPECAKGNITSGGSIANLTALTVAKKSLGISSKNISSCCIYLGEHTHHSIVKALNVTGLNEMVIRRITLNQQLKMDIDTLQYQIEKDKEQQLLPAIIVSSAGTTNAGAVDDLPLINDIAVSNNMWHHSDAAYGGFFVLTETGKKLLNGLSQANSITLDPHKGLFQSYGSGMVLFKDGNLLAEIFSEKADYMRDTFGTINAPADLSIELSRPFRALPLWFSLKAHGVAKFEAALDEKLQLIMYTYTALKELDFILGPVPQLSVLLFRLKENEKTEDLLKSIHENCSVFLSSTHSFSQLWIRVAILSHRTSKKEIDDLLCFLRKWIQNH